MIFNSIAFMLYLPIVFCLYWGVFKKIKSRNAFIVAASYVFYGWWDWRFLLLIIFTSLCSYISGLLIDSYRSKTIHKSALWGNIIINLGILATFKYFNFFISNLQSLLTPLGLHLDNITVNLILPVGISFYTFQSLSYTIDVYRGKIKATHDILAFFAFVSFFPQLVAGPIERATNLLPQFLTPRKFDYSQAVDGCRQMLWGFFKKMVIADRCAITANEIFAGYEHLGGIDLWIGALMFTIQIYGDFSGYSDIAIGTAKLFNIRLMRNFNMPYFSRNIGEFWRRWHISLNTWFVDYVYIPLGGSRCRKSKVIRNTFIIFLLSGLWHGAEWTFIVWGAYNAILLMPLAISEKKRKYIDIVAQNRKFPTMRESLMMGRTFLLITIGWVLFRADNISMAFHYMRRMFSNFSFTGYKPDDKTLIFIAVMFIIEWLQRHRDHTMDISNEYVFRYKIIRWGFYYLLAMVTIIFYGQHNDFIYFQF